MTLDLYLSSPESKYAVISTASYESDSVAQSISSSPRQFDYQGVSMTLLSLEPNEIPNLVEYASQIANGVEFELTIGSGKVTLLLHSQVLKLLENDNNQPNRIAATKEQ